MGAGVSPALSGRHPAFVGGVPPLSLGRLNCGAGVPIVADPWLRSV